MKKIIVSLGFIFSLTMQASSPESGYGSPYSDFSSPLVLTAQEITDFNLKLAYIEPLPIDNDQLNEKLIEAMEIALYQQTPSNFLNIILEDQTGYGSSNFYKEWIAAYYYKTTPRESLSFESFAENNPDLFEDFVTYFNLKTNDFLDNLNAIFISSPYKTLYETIQLLENKQAQIDHGSIKLVQQLLEDNLITEDALTYIEVLIKNQKITAKDLADYPEIIIKSFQNQKAFQSTLTVALLSQLEPEQATLLINKHTFLLHSVLNNFEYFKKHLPLFAMRLQEILFQELVTGLMNHLSDNSLKWLKAFPHAFNLNFLIPQDYQGIPIKGFTLLQLAFLQNDFRAFKTFLDYGANPNLLNSNGLTPLQAMLINLSEKHSIPNPMPFFFTLLDYDAHITKKDALALSQFATDPQKQKINKYLKSDFNTIPTVLNEPFEFVEIQYPGTSL